jgi:hypothetical protein
MFGATFAGAIIVAYAGAAQAATIITFDEAHNAAPPRPMTMTLDTDRLRLNSASFELIYRGDLGKAWVLQPAAKTYLEMSPAAMAPVAAKMDAATAMIKQKLAALPEAQRKQLEAMIAKRMGGPAAAASPPPATTYQKTGDARQLGAWSCTPFHVTVSGKFGSDVCIAKLDDVGLTRDDLSAFASFAAFMGKVRSAMSRFNAPITTMDLDSMAKAIGFVGFPIQTSAKVGIAGRIVTTLKSVDHRDAPAGTFDIPAGYSKVDFGAMLRKIGAPG